MRDFCSVTAKPHMTITRFIVKALLGGALLTPTLRAQEAVTTTADNTSEVEITTPGFSPFTQLSPDDGSLRAGVGRNAPVFDLPRRITIAGSLLSGYDDNVNLTPNGSPSWYVNPVGNFSYVSGGPRIALTLSAGAGVTYYLDHPGGRDYDPNLHLDLVLAYKVTPRLTLDFSTSTSYQSQPDFSTTLSVNRRLGSYLRSESRISANYRFTPRFSSVTSYAFDALEFESSVGAASDRMIHTFGEALRYLLFPTTVATAQYRLGLTESENDATTHSFIAGVDQTFSPRLSALLRGGVQLRSSENGGGRTSPYAEGTIHYALGPSATEGGSSGTSGTAGGSSASSTSSGASIDWSNRYSIEESDIPGGSGRETYRTNLALIYPVTGRITASLALSYLHGDNEGSGSVFQPTESGSSSQNVFDISTSVRYAITPHFGLSFGYRHSQLDRGLARALGVGSEDSEVFRNRYFAGVNITF